MKKCAIAFIAGFVFVVGFVVVAGFVAANAAFNL